MRREQTAPLAEGDCVEHWHNGSRCKSGSPVHWAGLIALMLGLLFALATSAHGGERTLRVGAYKNSPKIDIGVNGKAEGIFVDIIEAIAQREGWTIEYVPGTWGEGLDRLASGQIDLMPDVARTSERERLYRFHDEPVLASWNQVYARRNSGIRSLLDLDGKRIAILDGSVQEESLRQMLAGFSINATPLPQPDYDAAFKAVAESRADAVITNRFFGVRNAQTYGLEDTAIIFSPSRLFFAAPQTADPAVLAAIDRHLVPLKKESDSLYFKSLRRWSEEIGRSTLPSWLPTAAVALLGGLAGLFVWGATLRRQVAAKTSEIEKLYAQEREYAAELESRVAARTRDIENLSFFLQAIIDHIPNAIFYKGADLRFRGCNDAYEQTFGVRRSDFVGKTVLDLSYLPLADREAYQAEDAHVVATSSTLCREAIIPFADGREHHTLYSVSGFFDNESNPAGMVGIIVDITPQKEAAAQLREAKQRAEHADRLKSAFLATMSHELRTPLNSIIGFTGVVLQGLAGPLTDEQKKQLGMVRDSARHLLALINDVLDISKIEAGEFRVAHEAFDIDAALARVVGIVRPLAEKKGLQLEVTHPGVLGATVGDSRRTEQVLLNLLSNAIKFTDHGSVSLHAERVSGFSSERGFVQAPAVRFSVADTGIGIRSEDMAILFQPFRQIESTLSRNHDGTGLGLAICRRLAAMMGGSIEASSRWQEGSVFSFTLPVVTPDNGAGS